MEYLYICQSKCPELDQQNEMHCVTHDPKNTFTRYPDGCPCGNVPNWQPIAEPWQSKMIDSEITSDLAAVLTAAIKNYDNTCRGCIWQTNGQVWKCALDACPFERIWSNRVEIITAFNKSHS